MPDAFLDLQFMHSANEKLGGFYEFYYSKILNFRFFYRNKNVSGLFFEFNAFLFSDEFLRSNEFLYVFDKFFKTFRFLAEKNPFHH